MKETTVEAILKNFEQGIKDGLAKAREAMSEQPEITAPALLAMLDEIALGQVGWECSADVMTFNGEPIGGTFDGRSIEIQRWWPALKAELAEYLARRIANAANHAPTERSERR